MAQITVRNPAGKDAGKVNLDDALFGVRPNVPLMHQVVTAQLAHRRAGTQSTKTRSEVRGGGAKPYRQKGTGNARQGSTNSPHYAGGGVAHGPKPRSYVQRTPKKMIKQALRSALSDRASDNKILVVDAWNFSAPKTKDASAALTALGLDGRVLVVIERDNAAAALSFRNIPEVQIIQPSELNAYDVLCNDWIVFTQESLSFVEEGAARAAAKAKAGPKVAAPRTGKAERAGIQQFASAETPERGQFADANGGDVATVSPDTQTGEPVIQHLEGEYAGSVQANDDGSQPAGFEIKGNADSMLYHVPDSRWYDATVAEVWFDTEESAIAAGFTKAGARKSTDDSADDADASESEQSS